MGTARNPSDTPSRAKDFRCLESSTLLHIQPITTSSRARSNRPETGGGGRPSRLDRRCSIERAEWSAVAGPRYRHLGSEGGTNHVTYESGTEREGRVGARTPRRKAIWSADTCCCQYPLVTSKWSMGYSRSSAPAPAFAAVLRAAAGGARRAGRVSPSRSATQARTSLRHVGQAMEVYAFSPPGTVMIADEPGGPITAHNAVCVWWLRRPHPTSDVRSRSNEETPSGCRGTPAGSRPPRRGILRW